MLGNNIGYPKLKQFIEEKGTGQCRENTSPPQINGAYDYNTEEGYFDGSSRLAIKNGELIIKDVTSKFKPDNKAQHHIPIYKVVEYQVEYCCKTKALLNCNGINAILGENIVNARTLQTLTTRIPELGIIDVKTTEEGRASYKIDNPTIKNAFISRGNLGNLDSGDAPVTRLILKMADEIGCEFQAIRFWVHYDTIGDPNVMCSVACSNSINLGVKTFAFKEVEEFSDHGHHLLRGTNSDNHHANRHIEDHTKMDTPLAGDSIEAIVA